MTQNQEFGARLRWLRRNAGMSLRVLAEKVDVDFTYLSKIENGMLPPPSEKVIGQLAEVLRVDRDELLALAGRIPSDIAEILKDGETLKRLRTERDMKAQKVMSASKKEEAAHRADDAGNLAKKSGARPSFARVAIATILVIVVGTLLWFAAPTADTAIAANNQGVVYNNSGEYLKAIAAFDKAITLDPNLAQAYNNRAWSYLGLGEYEQAIIDCNKAIDLDPGLALAYSNRGLAYVRLGHYEQAIADCNKAIDLDPGLALAYSNRGQAYIGLGKYEEAITDFNKAIRLDPSLQK